ncbi:MAG: ABC transporter ATP-binding protein/permease [Kiritimatiellae bacterium]|nr:ABC transporter ATP-binding protein/permease [Kiritimatiellia bacterium]MDW8457527.1 ABC transporter ATP-binding protein [Verrucomicrobiota bacterium]
MSTSSHRLNRYLRVYRGSVALGALCVSLYLAGSVANPIVLRKVIDGMQEGTPPADTAIGLTAFLGIAATVFACSVAMRRTLLGLANRVEHDLRRDVFQHLTQMDAAFFQRERTGDLMTKMSSDLAAIREMIGQGLLQGSRMALGFPLAFGVMFTTNVRLAAIVAALLPVISVLFFVLIRLVRRYYDLAQEQFSTIANFAQETFAGIRTIKGFGIEDRRRHRFAELNREFIRRNMALSRIEEPVWPFMMFLYWIGAVLLLVFAGHQILRGEISLGVYVQFQQHLVFLQWPMLALGWTINLFQRGRTSWSRVRQILDARPDVVDPPPAVAVPFPAGAGIDFRGVCLRLGERNILNGITLHIPAGQCLGITGPTGSGKTMMAALLARLFDPSEGEILIGGVPINRIPLAELRRRIGMVQQEPFLFSDTVAGNLSFGLEPAEDPFATHEAAIRRVAAIAHLTDEIREFSQEFHTPVGERGVTLSGGQRRRAALARALAREPQILVLDDVFSAVDTQTESKILDALIPAIRGKTVLLISHRVSTLRHADRIIVLDGGRIVQDGRHEELVNQSGYYRELDEIQRLEARLEDPA